MRIFFVTFLSLIIGCTVVTVEKLDNKPESKIVNIMDYQTVSPETPEDFEKKTPQSSLILNSVIHFKKGFYTKKLSENVEDFDFKNGLIVILKNDKILTNYENCTEILLDETFDDIEINNWLISVKNENSFRIYDLKACGTIFSMDAKQKNIKTYGDKILVFQNRYFEILNFDKSVYLSGNLFNRISKGHIYNNKVYLIDDKSNCVEVDLIAKTMHPMRKFNPKDTFFQEDSIYNIVDKSLLRINLNNFNVEDNLTEGDFIAKSGNLIILTKNFKSNFNGDAKKIKKIRYKDDTYFVLMEKELYAFDFSKEIFDKEIIFGNYKPVGCSNGHFYKFVDITGGSIYIDLKKISLSHKVEDFICEIELIYKEGAFYYPNEEIAFRFADVVQENDEYIMLKRVIDKNNVYFFFDKRGD